MSLIERLGFTYCMACGGRLRKDYTHVDLPGKRVFLTDRDWAFGNNEPEPVDDDALWAGSPYQAAE